MECYIFLCGEMGGDWRESPFDGPVFALLKRRS